LIETLNYFAAGNYPPPVPGTPAMPAPGVGPTAGAAPLVIVKIDAALSAVNDLNADLGVKMKMVEQVNIRLKEEIDLATEFIGIVNDADLAEVLTRISQDEVSLEASYRVTGQLRGLSLANFI
jgi:flagellin-like hook-associated protein FlgL